MLPNWAVDDDRLGGYDLLVYMALIRHADNTGICWPSLERLAKIARCSQPTVSKSLNRLEQLGYIRRVKSDGRANRYHVSVWRPTPKQGYDPAPTPKPAFDPAPTPKPAFDPSKRAFDLPQNEVLTNNTQENKTQEQSPREEEKKNHSLMPFGGYAQGAHGVVAEEMQGVQRIHQMFQSGVR